MKRAIFLGTLLLVGCGRSSLPLPGDIVAPRLFLPVTWNAGDEVDLWVELAATNKAGNSRRLGFAASPSKNPIANVVFYDETGGQIRSKKVELSQRCRGGLYNNLVQVAANTAKVDMTITIEMQPTDFTVAALEKKNIRVGEIMEVTRVIDDLAL